MVVIEKAPTVWGFFYAYSLLKLSIGFANAAFTACKLTMSKVISNAAKAVPAKIHQLNPLRYSYDSSQRCIPYQETGSAIGNAIHTSVTKSPLSNLQ